MLAQVLMLTDGQPSDRAQTTAKFAELKRAGCEHTTGQICASRNVVDVDFLRYTVMMLLIGGGIRSRDVAGWTTVR